MFVSHTSIHVKDCPDIEFGSKTGKVTVSFLTQDHASLAFRTLAGKPMPDKTGRLQKRVFLKNGDYIQVRQMTKPSNDTN